MGQMRTCKKCGTELSIEMFDEGRHHCKICRKAYRKNRRKEHPEIHLAQALRRQDKKGKWLNSLKTPCIICGESEPYCIDFHHINPDDKKFTIGASRGLSESRIKQEIAKCVCLCSNCHRKVHAGKINLEEYVEIR